MYTLCEFGLGVPIPGNPVSNGGAGGGLSRMTPLKFVGNDVSKISSDWWRFFL